MELADRLQLALESLTDHPRRVIASAMGVFWGAAAIVLVLAWGSGFREYMRTELSSFGKGVVFLFPARTSSGFPGHRKGVGVQLSREDGEVAERVSSELIDAVLPEHVSEERVLAEAEGRTRRLDLSGVDERYARYRNFQIGRGRFFDASDVSHARAVTVLGHEAAELLFGSADAAVGRTLRLAGQGFEVVGVADEKGRQYTNNNRPDNRLVLVPITTAEERLGFHKERVSRLLLFPRPGADPNAARLAVLAALGPRAGFHPDDVDAIKWFDLTQILGLVDVFYAGFMVFIGVTGTITLLIGGVGIANYQLALLAERTVEIAVAKAIGARNRTLVVQTVLETAIVSGGTALGGVLLGLAGCAALRTFAPAGLFPTPIVSGLALAVTFLAMLGVAVVASAIPALRVRRMEISVALRASM
jgi:putative ABC transport system permease protein